ncbi:hypothetical protein M885DRAFT_615898 [Pelagophyceae sp. CCMP2097]|nr:hypothetical protein M885DRAFT_615898 [Pelagophyceae sp. CCMP2097]
MGDVPADAVPNPCCVCDAPNGKHCTKCKSRHYCSKKCQLIDWKEGGHKEQCKQLAAKFQDRLLDELMPAKLKIKEEPAIVEDAAPAAGLKVAARLSAMRAETTLVKLFRRVNAATDSAAATDAEAEAAAAPSEKSAETLAKEQMVTAAYGDYVSYITHQRDKGWKT